MIRAQLKADWSAVLFGMQVYFGSKEMRWGGGRHSEEKGATHTLPPARHAGASATETALSSDITDHP